MPDAEHLESASDLWRTEALRQAVRSTVNGEELDELRTAAREHEAQRFHLQARLDEALWQQDLMQAKLDETLWQQDLMLKERDWLRDLLEQAKHQASQPTGRVARLLRRARSAPQDGV